MLMPKKRCLPSGLVLWMRENRVVLPVIVLWAIAILVCAATIPQVSASARYRAGAGAGETSLLYRRMPDKDGCRSVSTDDETTVCVRGVDLPGAALAD